MLKRLVIGGIAGLLLLGGCSSGDDAGTDSEASSRSSTPRAVKDGELEALAMLSVPGYTASNAGLSLLGAGVTYTSEATTATGAQIQVVVRLAACDSFICNSLDPKEYAGAEEQRNLKSILPTDHINNPDLRWEFGEFELSDKATGLHTYAVTYLESKGADGSVSRSSANTFFAWWHDDSLFININAYPRGGDTTQSLVDLEKRMTRAQAEKAVRDVFAVFEAELP